MEEWRTVIVNGEVYENYMVSNLGRIKSLKDRYGNYREKILKLLKDKDNYLRVNLRKNGKRKNCKVHRLVAEAFIDKIEGKDFVDHINGIRNDNRIDNLRWCTHQENDRFPLSRKHKSENSAWKGKTGVWKGKTGELHHRSKAVLCIENGKIYGSTREAEKELKIDHSSISACCRGKLKSAGKHPATGEKLHWRYL